MADKVNAAVAITGGGDDCHRIVHQPVDMIIGAVADVRARARRITTLARRHRAITRIRQRRHLRAPAMHGFRKAVQQEHQRRPGLASGKGVEGEGGGGSDFFEVGHGG